MVHRGVTSTAKISVASWLHSAAIKIHVSDVINRWHGGVMVHSLGVSCLRHAPRSSNHIKEWITADRRYLVSVNPEWSISSNLSACLLRHYLFACAHLCALLPVSLLSLKHLRTITQFYFLGNDSSLEGFVNLRTGLGLPCRWFHSKLYAQYSVNNHTTVHQICACIRHGGGTYPRMTK